VLSLVVAPTTLATALLYYFGFELVQARSEYFGLGIGTLGFSTTDYLVRGVEAGIVPLIVLLLGVVVVVVLVAAGNRLAARAGTAPWFLWAARALLVAGVLITAAATYAAFRPLPVPFSGYLLPPFLLGVGPIAAAWGLRLLSPGVPRSAGVARGGGVAVFGLVVISTFWGMSAYADALGRGRAEQLSQSLVALPRATVYSERSLAIDPDVAHVERLAEGEQARYLYRYSGLRLLVRSDGKFFLLPDSWSVSDGRALVLRDESDIRIELAPGGGQ
jgi:hypothetical protein